MSATIWDAAGVDDQPQPRERTTLVVHPLADLMPAMSEAEYSELLHSIEDEGQRVPIVVDTDGRILDGRHRARACDQLGITPHKQTFIGTDEECLQLVLDLNLKRRHLNESQRAMIAARIATRPHGANQHAQICAPSQEAAADKLNVSRRLVQDARRVQTKGAPELIAAVDQGVIAVSKAAAIVQKPIEQQIARVERDRLKLAGESRQPDEFYRTPREPIEALLRHEKFGPVLWDPCCGDGAICRVVEEHKALNRDGGRGHQVIGTDLHDRGYGMSNCDFLGITELLAADIIMNPPYKKKLAQLFAMHALDLGAAKIALLGRLQLLEGEERFHELWLRRKLARVWCFPKRVTIWRGDDPKAEDDGGMEAYAWFIFEQDHNGPATLSWLDNTQ
jgi:ParB-like chromosome segregation protein Spo0J